MNKNRELVRDFLVNEVLGPTIDTTSVRTPMPAPDASGVVHLSEEDAKKLIFFDEESGEDYIRGMKPQMLYGTGVIHATEQDGAVAKNEAGAVDDDFVADEPTQFEMHIVGGGSHGGAEEGESSFALEQTQKRFPSAIGLTFHPEAQDDAELVVSFSGAVYVDRDVQYAGSDKPYKWHLRQPISGSVKISWSELMTSLGTLHEMKLEGTASDYIEILLRLRQAGQTMVLTVVANHRGKAATHQKDVFQSEMIIHISDGSHFKAIPNAFPAADLEMQETEYLYRHASNFATGHGVAAYWNEPQCNTKLQELQTKAIPEFYQEVLDFNHLKKMNFSMIELSKLSRDGVRDEFRNLVDGYDSWIQSEKDNLDERSQYYDAAMRMVSRAQGIKKRMQAGIDLLSSEDGAIALHAFKLANEAMFLQQRNGARKKREMIRPPKNKNPRSAPSGPIRWDDEIEPTDFGTWRPFQIAFLLASLEGMVDPTSPDREEVDLIFFPTGGGKTEAYLGASAFTIFYDRLTNKDGDSLGTNVLMRYTLRLLTIQQFERSSGLISAMEFLRRSNEELLGTTKISIGIWVGNATTKNSRSDLVAQLKPDKKPKADEPHPFILSKCPWCSRQFGWNDEHKAWVGFSEIKGDRSSKTLHFVCRGADCAFSGEENYLPIWLCDEDIYEVKPSFILATVDKFARMAWKPEARNIFNINSSGERIGRPPALIIQDEMHLISGPLGSMVGLYEGVIEKLCTDDRATPAVRPKIVASTATTRRYREQIASLYSRPNVTLFPQAISRANETFFSTVKRDESGALEKGTLYLGLNPATYATGQTAAAKVTAVLSQAPSMEENENDPGMNYYRTQMWFFNSLRELGMTQTVMNSTAQDAINGMQNDKRIPKGKRIYFDRLMELTSRIPANEVASSLSDLEETNESKLIQACLASSIMEVGVDVKRLGLLTIMGQPKTTSQYIQVSGRVGRDRSNGPGLVVMLYNTTRSRDRSMYERFLSYHQRLYAQVEPVSVTPFALEAMKHGLWGAILSMYRMKNVESSKPDSIASDVWDEAVQLMRDRIHANTNDSEKLEDFEALVRELKLKWGGYLPPRWAYTPTEENDGIYKEPYEPALMRFGKVKLRGFPNEGSIQIPASMRSVDGQTEIIVSHNPYSSFNGKD